MGRESRMPAGGGSGAPGPQDRRGEFLRERGLADDPAFYGADDAEREESAAEDPAPDGDGPETEDEPRR